MPKRDPQRRIDSKQSAAQGGGGTGIMVGGTTSHDIAGPKHYGTLDDIQAPQFLKGDGTRPLIGNLSVSGGVTIDGVDLDVHAADPDAHHNRATGVNAIAVTVGQAISLNLRASNPGLADDDGLYLGTPAAVSASTTNTVIGTGHSHQVLAYSDAVTYPSQLLRSDAQSSVILNRLTANEILAPNVLRIAPATRVDFADGTTLRNENFASTIPAITGWQINEVAGVAGWYALTIGAIQTDELHTRVFVSDEVRVDRGEEYWAKSYGIVADAFTMPGSINGTVAVTFEDSPIMAGAVFSNGDWLMFQQVDTSGGGFSNVRVWGTVAGYTDNGDGTQTWTFTLRQGTTGLDFQAGALAVDFGQSGQGTIHLSAIDLSGAPYIRFGRWAGANPYTPANITTHVQIGNLTSLGTVSGSPTGTYGIFAAGNGQTAELSDAGVILRDADFTQYDGANQVVSISGGNVLFGRNVASALDTGFTFTAATGDLIIGQPAGQKLVWDESEAELSFSGTLTVLPGSSGFGDFIDANMDNIEDGVNYERVSSTIIAGGLIQVQAGPSYGTKDSTLRGWNIGASEIVGQYDGVDQVVLNTSGNIVAGNGNVVLSRGGVDLRMAAYDRFTMPTTENDRAVSWWPDPANRTGSPLARMYASQYTAGSVPPYLVLEVDPGNADPDLSPWLMLWADGKSIWFGVDTIVGFPGLDASRNPTTGIETLTFGTSDADQIVQSYVSVIPVVSSAVDLGSASRYWRRLYVDELVAGTVTGGTQLTGQIWQFDSGDMYVRSTSSGNRVLYIANPGAGSMSLNVEGSIVVGGTVDGVDVSTLPGSISAVSASVSTVQTNLNTHAANANAHHAQSHVLATTSGLGPDHTVNDLTTGFVLRATGAAAARFMQLAHGDLSGIGANDHHAQSHVLATTSGLGPDHTVSGLTAGYVLRASSATTAAFAQLAHSDLSGIGPNDHHNRQHSITSTADHTATGAQWQIIGLTATNTLGLLTPSANGATEAILKSDSGGGLNLDNLTLVTRLRSPLLDTASGVSMTVQPASELRLDPGGNILRIMADTLTRTDSYDPELTGWAVSYAGAADFRRTFSNTMHVERLVADLEQALAGRQIIGKSVAKIATAFTAPAFGATATLTIKDWQESPGVAVFESGDYVLLSGYSRGGGGLTVDDCWGVVTGYTDNGNGTQSWTFTRSAGSISYNTIAEIGTATNATAAGGAGYASITRIGVSTAITNSGAGLTVNRPSGTASGHVMIALVASYSSLAMSSAPSGWTLLENQAASNSEIWVYYRVAGGSEPASYTWTLNGSDDIAGYIVTYGGVDTSTPIDVSTARANATASSNVVGNGVTTLTDNAMLLFMAGINDDATAGCAGTAPSGMTEVADVATSSWSWAYLAEQLLGTAGSTGTRTGTLNQSHPSAVATVALRPAPGGGSSTSVAPAVPAGTTTGHVMIAGVSYGGTPNLTAPSGWTRFVGPVTSGGVTVEAWRRVAGAGEPATYTWSLDTTDSLEVGVMTFENVNTSSPIDASGSQSNASSTSMVAPTIDPVSPASMLIFIGAPAGNIRATAPSGMTERVDAGAGNASIYMARQLLANGNPTGTRTATLASAAANAAILVALLPSGGGGGEGGSMVPGTTLGADSLVFDYGTAGDGVYQINAIDNVYARAVTWTGHPATGQTTRALMGDLSVLGFGVADEHGFYAGNGTAVTSSYLRLSNNTFELHNLPLRLFDGGGTETVHIAGWNDVWFGTNPAARAIEWNGSALTIRGAVYITGGDAATQSYVTTNSARPNLSNVTANWAIGDAPGGNASNALNLNGTSGATVVSNANRAALGLNGSGYVSLPLRSSNIASTTAVTGLNLTNTHLGYHDGSNWRVWIQSSGAMYFGGASGARLEWDGSRLSGYNNLGAEQWYAGSTTGQIVAGGGAVWLDSDGINIDGGLSTYSANRAIEWYSAGTVSVSLAQWSATDNSYARLRSYGYSNSRRDGVIWLEAESHSSVGAHVVRLELDTNHATYPSATLYVVDPAVAAVNVYEASLEYTYIRSRYGYLRIGPQNAGYCHYTTDRPSHWFNTTVEAGNNTIRSYDGDFLLQRAGTTRLYLDASGAVTVGRHHVSGGAYNSDLGNYANTLGYAQVGYIGHSAYAGFAHRSAANSTQYAMIQDSAGTTFLNSSGVTYLRINNTTVGTLQSWGMQIEGTINVGQMIYLLSSYTPVNPAAGARVHAYWTGANWELRVRFPNGNTVVVARDNLAGNH